MAAQGGKPRNQEIQKMFEEADMDGKGIQIIKQTQFVMINFNQLNWTGDGEIDWTEFLDLTKKRMKLGKTQPAETAKVVERKGFKPQKVK